MSAQQVSYVLEVEGELDLMTAADLRGTLLGFAAASESSDVVVDLSGVTFMDVAGLRPFLDCQGVLAAEGRRLRLRSVSRPARRILQLAGVGRELDLLQAVPACGPGARADVVGRPGAEA